MAVAFQLIVLGDFAGAATAERRLVPIDRDSFDAVLARIAPRVETDLPYCAAFEVRGWEDLSPDGLARGVPALASLIAARDAVGDAERMQALIAEAGVAVAPGSESDSDPAEPRPEAIPNAEGGDLLDSMLDDAPASAPRPRRYADREFDELLAQITDRTESIDFASQDRWREAIDREIGARVRSLLHHPDFRSVEAAWAGLRELLRAGDTDEAVRVSILPLTRAQLLDPASLGTLERLLFDERGGTPGAPGVDLIVADHAVGDDEDELAALAGLGALAERCAAPLLVGAAPALADLDSPPSRALAELAATGPVQRVGLCCPRVLVRLPYGRDTAPVDGFDFEEIVDETPVYAFGTAAMVIARAAVRALTVEGSLDALPRYGAIDGLPFHAYRAAGEARSQHPVEHVMTDAMLKELVGRGLLPLAAVVGSDEARLVSLRSLGGRSLLD